MRGGAWRDEGRTLGRVIAATLACEAEKPADASH